VFHTPFPFSFCNGFCHRQWFLPFLLIVWFTYLCCSLPINAIIPRWCPSPSLCLLSSFNVVEMWILPFHFMELPKVRPWFPFSNTMHRSFRSWGTLRRNENFKPNEALDSVRSCEYPLTMRFEGLVFNHFIFRPKWLFSPLGLRGRDVIATPVRTWHDENDLQRENKCLVRPLIKFVLLCYPSDFFSYRSIM